MMKMITISLWALYRGHRWRQVVGSLSVWAVDTVDWSLEDRRKTVDRRRTDERRRRTQTPRARSVSDRRYTIPRLSCRQCLHQHAHGCCCCCSPSRWWHGCGGEDRSRRSASRGSTTTTERRCDALRRSCCHL